MVRKNPGSFPPNELLGLTYSAQAKKLDAVAQLRKAAKLAPQLPIGQVNLGIALIQEGEVDAAQAAFERARTLDPQSFDANHNLAAVELLKGQVSAAKPFLEAAHTARPDDDRTTYNLALASMLTGHLREGKELTNSLLSKADSSELHTLLGRINEKEGNFLPAADQFAMAAKVDPSEDNLFVWASEMLLHRTYEPAIQIFREGTRRYPNSPRLWVGLGMSLYSRGEYKDAIQALLQAARLDPKDPRCYLFLSKAYLSAPDQAQAVIDVFRRYAELEPRNARAQYYYAMSLWKGRREQSGDIDYPAVEALLQKSVQLDGSNADVHLQLGILYNDMRAYEKCLPEYERALQLDPGLAEAHFRLGRFYLRAGEKEKSEVELARFKTLQAEHQAEVDKERAEVQQFVVTSGSSYSGRPE